MRILYGVQGTGNGHLSRARAMARAFAGRGVTVDYLFSGRPRAGFFAMGCFGDFQWRRGLTFVSEAGRVSYLKTVLGNDYPAFLRDVRALDVAPYDIILSDFEPVTAWAGWLRRKVVVSLGHQPAFDYRVPMDRRDLRALAVMRLFAPGTVRIGMHWAPFGAPLLPPLVDLDPAPPRRRRGKILVYLPFEDPGAVSALLRPFLAHEFFVYAPGSEYRDEGNLHLRPTSLEGFRRDLADCDGVIGNAGFELASECLALGKRLLVKPQGRQMEQASNALALHQLGYGACMERLDARRIGDWLDSGSPPPRLHFPDVAGALVDWLLAGDYRGHALSALSDRLWNGVRLERVAESVSPAPAQSLALTA
ncbi:MJ1255/VC2487 family glycosyltransferase [Pseudohaliea rubra]|uniref:Glycosyltransferase n=1 Tax=Pseudohaliea rubra DSM 19751 TaxID=1265313 RepID=A0A095VS79_9GAMM|nr:MJ1255/VC2487 family glycosyltransferase [Pseudohaliea rubra]KGE03948.1 Glycosyltransferase [Pseudohaliea rubra DSM 19751]